MLAAQLPQPPLLPTRSLTGNCPPTQRHKGQCMHTPVRQRQTSHMQVNTAGDACRYYARSGGWVEKKWPMHGEAVMRRQQQCVRAPAGWRASGARIQCHEVPRNGASSGSNGSRPGRRRRGSALAPHPARQKPAAHHAKCSLARMRRSCQLGRLRAAQHGQRATQRQSPNARCSLRPRGHTQNATTPPPLCPSLTHPLSP